MQAKLMIRTCSIWRALEVVGDTPTLLILEGSMLGARRFDDLWRLTGLLKALLSDRIKRLVEAGVLEKRLYCKSPPRSDYHLTAKGRDLYWVALMLLRWELKWHSQPGKIDVRLTHIPCGHEFVPEPACGSCSEPIDASQVDWEEGPGVGWMVPHYSRRRQQRLSTGSGTTLFEQSAQLMGDRWGSLIMRSIFTGIRRFDEIQRDTAIATNILAERLAWLSTMGVIRQHAYSNTPTRFEYRVTRKGVDYYPVMLMLMQWGDKYYVSPEGSPLRLRHRMCGKPLQPIVVCPHCRLPVTAADVKFDVDRQGSPAEKINDTIVG